MGSLRAVADTTGAIVKRVDYGSFGNILSEYRALGTTCPELVEGFGFAGGLHDRDTGLVRFGARDYDPAIGKWTAKDPIDFAGGDLNLFGYSLNDPVNLVDSNGIAPLAGYEDNYATVREIREWHYNRASFNKIPANEGKAKEENWMLMDADQSVWHRMGPGNENNKKYVSPHPNKAGGSSEVVYHQDRSLATDPANIGTYNYVDHRVSVIGHLVFDVVPYIFWGNTPSDPTSFWERLMIPLKKDVSSDFCN